MITITVKYIWESEKKQKSFQDIGKAFLDVLLENWEASNPITESQLSTLGSSICDMIWPTLRLFLKNNPDQRKRERFLETTEMILIPLDRLGQEQGKSGAKSVLCCFKYSETDSMYDGEKKLISLPIIIKSEECGNHLEEEFQGAKGIIPYARSSQTFVLPILRGRTESNIEYLMSKSIVGYNGNDIEAEDAQIHTFLECLLNQEANDKRTSILDYVYKKLRDIHLGPSYCLNKNEVVTISYKDEYNRYLRGMNLENITDITPFWCKNPLGKCRECQENDCPIIVFHRVYEMNCSMHLGGIHGDIHPRNIVCLPVDAQNGEWLSQEVYIIDYGWASDNAHIAKDYVLMECNLRFMCLLSTISYLDMEILTQAITEESISDAMQNEALSEYAKGVVQLIERIRSNFYETICGMYPKEKKEDIDWNYIWLYEYYIPMFLVAFGLTKFYENCMNQMAMRETLTYLSKLLMEKLIEGTVDL